jgi:nitroreductase/NAD-dependent dihydropyrimidine dehydrogenase PreA subunit
LCGVCASVCVRNIIDASGNGIKLNQPETCIFCGHCKAVCPEDAIEIPSYAQEEFVPAPQKENFPSADNLLAFFRFRRSTRIYQRKPVEQEKIRQIIEAGRFAPTGGNFQELRFAVAHTPEMINEIRGSAIHSLSNYADRMMSASPDEPKAAAFTSNPMVLQRYAQTLKEMARKHDQGVDSLLWNAPVLIVIHVSSLVESPGVDVGLGAMQMVLMAEALGLGTCFIGFIPMAIENSPDLKKLLKIPDSHQAVTAFVAGYPDVSYLRLVSRKPARVRWL